MTLLLQLALNPVHRFTPGVERFALNRIAADTIPAVRSFPMPPPNLVAVLPVRDLETDGLPSLLIPVFHKEKTIFSRSFVDDPVVG
jgi:hypothetical protein